MPDNSKLDKLKVFLPEGEGVLTEEICIKMLEAAELPENIIKHCKAVKNKAVNLARALNEKAYSLDLKLIESAALLHDICRLQENHPAAGAELLAGLGYEAEADIIRQHHDLDDDNIINEAAIVYLADKLIKGDRPVSLSERFEQSSQKCRSPEAAAAHKRRYKQAKKVLALVENILNN